MIWVAALVICLIIGGLFMRMSNRIKLGHGPRTATVIVLPANTVSPAITGTTTEGQTLTGSDGTWTLSPVLTRQWLRNGSPIGGATSGTYLLVTADVGATIALRVTANGTVVATSASVGPIIALSASTPTNTVAPDLTGTPRDGQPYWLYAGEWSVGTNYYRFIMKRDGSTFRTVTQSDDVITGTWAATEVGKLITATVEGSLDGGATYSAPVAVELLFPFFSDMITPATIAAPVLTRTSASGVTPMTFTVAGSPYSSYLMEMKIEEVDNTLIWRGTKPFAESDLVSPFTPDWSGETDPVPSSIPPAVGADDYVSMRFMSADYYESEDGNTVFEGVASAWSNEITPTNAVLPLIMDSGDAVNFTVADGGLTAIGLGNGGIYSSRAVADVDGYIEFDVTTLDGYWAIGLFDSSIPNIDSPSGSNSFWWFYSGFFNYSGAGGADTTQVITAGATRYKMFVSRTLGKVWAGTVAGGWYGGENPNTNTGGRALTGLATGLHLRISSNANSQAKIYPTTASWTGTPPTGAMEF